MVIIGVTRLGITLPIQWFLEMLRNIIFNFLFYFSKTAPPVISGEYFAELSMNFVYNMHQYCQPSYSIYISHVSICKYAEDRCTQLEKNVFFLNRASVLVQVRFVADRNFFLWYYCDSFVLALYVYKLKCKIYKTLKCRIKWLFK